MSSGGSELMVVVNGFYIRHADLSADEMDNTLGLDHQTYQQYHISLGPLVPVQTRY